MMAVLRWLAPYLIVSVATLAVAFKLHLDRVELLESRWEKETETAVNDAKDEEKKLCAERGAV